MTARFILEASGPSGRTYRLELSISALAAVVALVSRIVWP